MSAFGISQVLPALVQAFYCPEGSMVWMEQPEIHLHPQVQAELADVFISAVHAYEHSRPRNVQLIIETHSEHFLNRLQRRIAEETIKPSEMAIYFAQATSTGAELEELTVNKYGTSPTGRQLLRRRDGRHRRADGGSRDSSAGGAR